MNREGRHILVVDDNIENLRVTTGVLKEEGYLISLAQSGKDALEQIERDIPDLILLDIMMPEMNGYEVCNKIKANHEWEEVPVIFLTAKHQTEDLVKGFEAGGVDYITKPFNRDELLVRIKNHLALKEAKEEIDEMNRTRDKLYSIIAHDIRSPFSSITQTIDAVAHGVIDVHDDDFLELFRDLSNRTSETFKLLNNLLEWTKAQGREISGTFGELQLEPLILDIVALYEGNLRDKDITVSNTISVDAVAWCDETTIHTVFRNLLSNAIKFTPAGGKIEICSEVVGEEIKVFVKDSGVGMPGEVIDKIFKKDEYHTTPGTANEKGSGLGLYLVKDFVRKNRGRIEVESELGKGTKFIISLQRDKADG